MGLAGAGAARATAAALSACGLLALYPPASAFADSMEVSRAWSRPTPPGTRVGAVYLVITNHAAAADRLLAVSSPVAAKAQLHQSVHSSAVVQMRATPYLECPAGASVKVEPGAVHIMLMDLKETLAAGTAFPLTLQFRDAGSVTVSVSVKAQE